MKNKTCGTCAYYGELLEEYKVCTLCRSGHFGHDRSQYDTCRHWALNVPEIKIPTTTSVDKDTCADCAQRLEDCYHLTLGVCVVEYPDIRNTVREARGKSERLRQGFMQFSFM